MAEPAPSHERGRIFRTGHAYGEIEELLSAVQPKGLCLDLPAGEGPNSAGLRAAGFRPVSADLFPQPPAETGTAAVRTDWNAPLPFADGSFAAVLCSEGIEHHPAQTAFLRELGRVLSPGGTLVLTTPNTLSLEARLSHLFNGHHAHNRSAISEVTQIWNAEAGPRAYVGHVHMANYFMLRFMLWRAGLVIERVATARFSKNALVLAPLLWLPVQIGTRRVYAEVKDIDRGIYDEIVRHVLSVPVLFGKKLILVVRKPA
ncbi:MAG: methyltransferase domain-containing protein [Planctomycetota bacterium]